MLFWPVALGSMLCRLTHLKDVSIKETLNLNNLVMEGRSQYESGLVYTDLTEFSMFFCTSTETQNVKDWTGP